MFKPDLQRQRNQRSNWQHPLVHRKGNGIKKKHTLKRTSTSASLTTIKPLTVWITTNCGKFFKRWEYQTTLLDSLEICMQVKKQQLELDSETDWFQIGKGICQDCILSPCLFNLYVEYICEMPDWMKYKLESGLPEEILIASDKQMIPPLWHKVKRN